MSIPKNLQPWQATQEIARLRAEILGLDKDIATAADLAIEAGKELMALWPTAKTNSYEWVKAQERLVTAQKHVSSCRRKIGIREGRIRSLEPLARSRSVPA